MSPEVFGLARRLGSGLAAAALMAAACGGGGGSSTPTAPTPPPVTPAAALASVSVTPASVVGTNSVQVSASLSAAAPSGGATVALSSSDTAVAPVPAGISIPAGSTSGSQSFTTAHVTADNNVTITGTFSGASQTATLLITPLLTARFTVRGDADGVDACRLAGGGAVDCDLDGSTSVGPVTRWLWTLIVAGEAPETYDRTSPVFRPGTDCGLFDRVPATSAGGSTFLQMEVRLKVFDAAGRESAETINRNVRVFPRQNCGRGF
ncbi:MAG: hypothetical protein AB7Q16_07035 [Vicinamibacterales bacterium]